MKALLLVTAIVLLGGCDAAVRDADRTEYQPLAPAAVHVTTPGLIELFSGADNLKEVRNAWSDSQISLLVVMYAGDRLQRLIDLVATDDSYDWTISSAGEFSPDITMEFLGPRYHDSSSSTRAPVIVHFDMQRELVEVDVPEGKHRASFAPAASRFDEYFKKLGFVPRSR